MATDTMSLVEKCQEIAREHGGKVSTALATLLLSCQMSMNTALAADPAQNQAPVAVSAPPTAKGYGQEIETQLGKLSFAEIQRHPNRKAILDGMGRSDKSDFRDWEEQAAIKEGQKIDQGTQAAIKEGQKIDQGTQAAIEELAKNAKKLESTVRAALQGGIKLSVDYKKTMNTVIAFGKPPETVKYFQEVLANPNNFSVTVTESGLAK